MLIWHALFHRHDKLKLKVFLHSREPVITVNAFLKLRFLRCAGSLSTGWGCRSLPGGLTFLCQQESKQRSGSGGGADLKSFAAACLLSPSTPTSSRPPPKTPLPAPGLPFCQLINCFCVLHRDCSIGSVRICKQPVIVDYSQLPFHKTHLP